jgi:hypothetical protein
MAATSLQRRSYGIEPTGQISEMGDAASATGYDFDTPDT